jgi:hypothetical protein
MAVDPLAVAGAAGGALQGIFGQQGPTNVEKHLAREGLNKQGAPIAATLSAKLATMPLADRAAFLLAQRLTPGVMSTQSFQPHDIFNPGASAATPQYNMQNQGALATANAGYQPGQGGFSPDVIQQALANLGSSHDQSYSTTAGAGAPWGAGAFAPRPTAGQVEAAKQKKPKSDFLGFLEGLPGPYAGGSGAPGGING